MTMAAIMPFVPLNPALTKTSEARINVIKVIPDTGFVPTIAIALAATVVNRKEIINTISMATMVWKRLPNTPNWKKMKVVIKVASKPIRINFIERSCCVRSATSSLPFFPPNSFTARPKACLIIPDERIMPTIPAIAIPPIPI